MNEFSLMPADLACYSYPMVNRQDTLRSPDSPEIARHRLAVEIISDGTKLPLERRRPKTTTDGRICSFQLDSIRQNRARGSGRARQRSAALALGAGLSPAVQFQF
jgi:hypothetical protein